jgi:uncharacterized membrane protein YesL
VTIGAATSALFEVTMRYGDHESGNLIKDYFPAFGRNFARATGLALVTGVPVVALGFSGLFWVRSPQAFALILGIVAFVAAAYLFAAFCYAMALTARYSSGFGRTLRNALLLPGAEPAHTFGIVILPIALIAISVVFPSFTVIMATIGFSVGAYGSGFLFRRVFSRYPA